MTVQIAVKLDDNLAEQVRAAAADSGTIRTDEQEAALMAARHRRALVALDE